MYEDDWLESDSLLETEDGDWYEWDESTHKHIYHEEEDNSPMCDSNNLFYEEADEDGKAELVREKDEQEQIRQSLPEKDIQPK